MNNNSFTLKAQILKSSHIDYTEQKYKKIVIKKKIGEGAYGVVFLIQNDHVIKIFKNSTNTNTILDESNYLIPVKNENRELIFFFKYINENNNEKNYIVNLYAIGIIKDKIIENTNIIDFNSYFIILPLCTPFYNKYKILNRPLIEEKNGIIFTLNVMKRLLEISQYLETKYNLINLDFKLNNFMFSKKNNDLNNLIMLDFSIVKKNTKKKYNINNKYYIWPNGSNLIENIPSYSICINGLELLFGYDNILYLSNNLNNYLKIIKDKNKSVYNIFNNGLIIKISTNKLLKLICNITI